ncbi:MAG: hypothetical protein BJ554DRAFT_6721 [Olpidium bornovanus]|uniref:Uncharacterized protein n=1 Tax=Olpidium bornovanus TaxID=278681 RepID=A0A8H7ZXR3_9FUNG|nr:MAG: hypothetical protein BJ554DRAFT_6721 [Olpidium bornovanus]
MRAMSTREQEEEKCKSVAWRWNASVSGNSTGEPKVCGGRRDAEDVVEDAGQKCRDRLGHRVNPMSMTS